MKEKQKQRYIQIWYLLIFSQSQGNIDNLQHFHNENCYKKLYLRHFILEIICQMINKLLEVSKSSHV